LAAWQNKVTQALVCLVESEAKVCHLYQSHAEYEIHPCREKAHFSTRNRSQFRNSLEQAMSAPSKITNNGSSEHRRPSMSYLYSAQPSQIKPDPAAPSTNKIILDYLLYLSIQSRLQQSALELDELASSAPEEKENEPEHIERRASKWRDTASRAERDKNAVESIVAGMNATLSLTIS
jgi:hypothetical protein